MNKYPSIETLFARDKTTNKLDFGAIRIEEFHAIDRWTVSEKIDGTNIRVIVTTAGIEVRGRTDNAQFSADTIPAILGCFPDHATLLDFFTTMRARPLDDEWNVCFYGEAYGPGIGKHGGQYSPVKRFRCFDLKLGLFWTSDDEMREACAVLGIPVVPLLIRSYSDAPYSRALLESIVTMSEVACQDGGDPQTIAEGIVAKPLNVLLDRYGNRIMWKMTFREFT